MAYKITVNERDIVKRLNVSETTIPPLMRRHKLRKIMDVNGLRAKDVGALVGYSPQSVRLWMCRSERNIPQYLLVRLYELVGWDIETEKPKHANATR